MSFNPYAETITRLDSIEKSISIILDKIWSGYPTETEVKQYYTRKEAADYLSCSIALIDKFVSQKKLSKKKIGAKTVFSIDDLKSLVR